VATYQGTSIATVSGLVLPASLRIWLFESAALLPRRRGAVVRCGCGDQRVRALVLILLLQPAEAHVARSLVGLDRESSRAISGSDRRCSGKSQGRISAALVP
jgi:hypothetical protein